MEYLAYAAAILMGILLGLIGGGGSVLTLPVFVFLLHIPPTKATTYSLFVVGLSALTGVIDYIRNNLISWKTILVFGLPSLSATYFARTFIVPSIPATLNFAGITFSKDFFILFLFAVLMIAAAGSMIRPPKVIRKDDYPEAQRYRYVLILLGGLAIGTLVGVLGAGGGFLIIPALVILANLPMKKAVGTSLGLIFINCTIGFTGDILHCNHPDWKLLLTFSAFAVTGIGIGLWLSRRIPGTQLKRVFGWVILVLGIAIVLKEYFFRGALHP